MFSSLASGVEGASVWDRVWSGDPYAQQEVRAVRAIRRLTSFELMGSSLPDNARLLDLGCGSGDSLVALSEVYGRDIELTGADFSSRAASLAAERLGDRAEIVRADATELPFRSGQFTHVLVFGVIEHIQDHVRALAEVHRVAQMGAKIYISTSNARSILQGINLIRRNTLGYPYGYQRNWGSHSLLPVLNRFFSLQSVEYEHADGDMPIVRSMDSALAAVFSRWGRYIHILCEKIS